MNWTPLQRETLEAMGLSPYRLASATPSVDAVAIARATAAQASIEPRTPNVAARGDASNALTTALLRAAGRGTDAPDRDAVLRACPSIQALRGDPRAKRALWPTLRALRRH